MAEVEVRPTEDIGRVKVALTNLISGTVLTNSTKKDWYVLRIESHERSSLDRFKMILQRDRIRAAARAVMLRNIRGEDTIDVYLNKQVAHAGHASFCQAEGESPLGPIHLMVQSSNVQSLIDWLTSGKN